MKIFTNDAVYVQKNDIGFLNQTDLTIPASIFIKVFGKGVTIIDNSNRFEFVEFKEDREIEFFRSLDWIVDYDSVKDLNEEQIIELGESVSQERNSIADNYNSMTDEEREKNTRLVGVCERLEFKINGLRDFFWFKQGQLDFNLPKGVEYSERDKKVEKKGKRRLLSKFRKANN